MLVLARKKAETILIGEDIVIKVSLMPYFLEYQSALNFCLCRICSRTLGH